MDTETAIFVGRTLGLLVFGFCLWTTIRGIQFLAEEYLV
jgi:hypothetical protein